MARNLVPPPATFSRRVTQPAYSARPRAEAQPQRDCLVGDNLGFAIKVACEHRNLGLPLGDLINEGCLGLIEAARRYDPTRGVKFVTYAAAWVRKSILRALLRHTRTIRIPAYHLDQVKRYQRVESLLASQLGRRPNREEVSRKLGTSGAKVDALLSRRILEVPLESGEFFTPGGSLMNRVEDRRVDNPEDAFFKDENHSLVNFALSTLNKRELFVIESRFGLRERRFASLAVVGSQLSLSRERVRQIEHQARQKMRRALSKKRLSAGGARAIMRERDRFARQPEGPRQRRGRDGVPG